MSIGKVLFTVAVALASTQANPALAACTYFGSVPSTPPVEYVGSVTASQNVKLWPGSSIVSPNGVYRLIFQNDGNLVLYRNGRAVWDTNTELCSPTPYSPLYTTFQTDGNFVVYQSTANTPTPFWDTNTQGRPNASLHVQNDGNVVIYPQAQAIGGTAIWARTW